MKKLIFLFIICCSCDKEVCSEYLIKNSTSLDLNLTFVENQSTKEININGQDVVNFVEYNCDTGGAPLLYLYSYDSIYVSDSNEILKVWKPESNNKNIYDVNNYWNINESSKDNFIYTFIITSEDLE